MVKVVVRVCFWKLVCNGYSKLSMVYQCVGCQTHSLQPLGHMSQPGVNSQPKFSLPGGPPVDINCFHCNHKHTVSNYNQFCFVTFLFMFSYVLII